MVDTTHPVPAQDEPARPADAVEVARIIGSGAVKYAELSQNRLTDYKFSWDKISLQLERYCEATSK